MPEGCSVCQRNLVSPAQKRYKLCWVHLKGARNPGWPAPPKPTNAVGRKLEEHQLKLEEK